MKRHFALPIMASLLALLILPLAGCGDSVSNDNTDNDAVQAYIEMAQEYLDEGDYDAAVEILEKGFSSTGDSEIGEMLKETIEKQLSADKGGKNHLMNDSLTTLKTKARMRFRLQVMMIVTIPYRMWQTTSK